MFFHLCHVELGIRANTIDRHNLDDLFTDSQAYQIIHKQSGMGNRIGHRFRHDKEEIARDDQFLDQGCQAGSQVEDEVGGQITQPVNQRLHRRD